MRWKREHEIAYQLVQIRLFDAPQLTKIQNPACVRGNNIMYYYRVEKDTRIILEVFFLSTLIHATVYAYTDYYVPLADAVQACYVDTTFGRHETKCETGEVGMDLIKNKVLKTTPGDKATIACVYIVLCLLTDIGFGKLSRFVEFVKYAPYLPDGVNDLAFRANATHIASRIYNVGVYTHIALFVLFHMTFRAQAFKKPVPVLSDWWVIMLLLIYVGSILHHFYDIYQVVIKHILIGDINDEIKKKKNEDIDVPHKAKYNSNDLNLLPSEIDDVCRCTI